MSINRRKFRSQPSDNMDRWKSRGGKSQRGEEQNREDKRRERVRRKKMQVREKVWKSRNAVFFEWFVAPQGWKVGSLKRRVRSHVVRWEMKNCTTSWREALKTDGFGALLEVEMLEKCTTVWREVRKNWRVRSTFGSWDVEKVHDVVARSTKKTDGFENFWKLRCWKSRRCGAKH